MSRFQCFDLILIMIFQGFVINFRLEQLEQKLPMKIFISARSIPNLKSTRTPEQIEQLSFGAFGAKIPL